VFLTLTGWLGRFAMKLDSGELRLISDEAWLTMPLDDHCGERLSYAARGPLAG
jgi:hypothetical protein